MTFHRKALKNSYPHFIIIRCVVNAVYQIFIVKIFKSLISSHSINAELFRNAFGAAFLILTGKFQQAFQNIADIFIVRYQIITSSGSGI